jgi:hypothetical protein
LAAIAESAQRPTKLTGLCKHSLNYFHQNAASQPLCCRDHTHVASLSGQVQTDQILGAALRSIAAMTLACALSACAGGNFETTVPGAGEWKFGQRADRVADQPVQSAGLTTKSRNAKSERNNPALPHVASLQLLCFDGEPVVRLYFSHEVGSNRNTRLTYKFDNTPATKTDARILQDFQTVMLEDKKDVVTFVNGLRDAKRLDITVSGLVAGNTIAEFNVEGAPAAIDASYKSCPLPAAPPPRTPVRRAKGA